MGFRNPVTTIGALDTGQGFAVGSVQSYTDNPTGALGSALHTAAGFQFRDGISGDTPAAVVNVANYVAQGAGALTEAGGGFTVAAGSYNGVQGPRLDLNVESASAGGYAPVLRLTAGAGGQVVTDTALTGPDTAWSTIPLTSGVWTAWDTASNLPRCYRDAAGELVLTGIAKLAVAFSPGGTSTVGRLPFAPRVTAHRPVLILTAGGGFSATGWLTVNANDPSLVVTNTTAATLAAGAGFTLGASVPVLL